MVTEIPLEDLKIIKREIETLNENEQLEVIKILINNDCKYTVNKNGLFVNLNILTLDIIQQLREYLEFSKENNKIIDNLIVERNNIIKN
jgi:hypothetical protein